MKQRFGTFALALVMALTLAIPAGAVDTSAISEELYQEYSQIAEEVGAEYGIEVTACPREEMDTVYSLEEYEQEVREFCSTVSDLVITGEGDTTTNPSGPKAGKKTLTVNTPISNGEGYFLITITGYAEVEGASPYYFYTPPIIKELTLIRRPSSDYTMTKIGSPVSGGSGATKTSTQKINLKRTGLVGVNYNITATFSLATSTGKVTMTASNMQTT